MPGSGPSTRRLLLLGAAVVTTLALPAHLPVLRSTPFPLLVFWVLGFALYALAARLITKGTGLLGVSPEPDHRDAGGGPYSWARDSGDARGVQSRRRVAVVWIVALVGRLALLPAEPALSDDIWRYLWDGHVQLQGLNPYLHAPEADVLAPFRTGWHSLVNHPAVLTIYPPGAQLVFWFLAAVGTRVLVFKAAWLAADLGTAWLLGRIARGRGLDPVPVQLLYLWCPLLLVEVAWSGHLAPLGLLPMMAAVWLSENEAGPEVGREVGYGESRGGWLSGSALGLAAAVKYAPAAGLPALVRRHGWRAAAAFVLVAGLAVGPFLGVGSRLWAGLSEYVARWSFHPGPFGVLESVLGTGPAKACAAATVAGLALRAGRERWPLGRALFWTIGAALMLTPTLHPWYLLWILPFAALGRRPGWILFTGTAFLSYAHLDHFARTGAWPQPLWLSLLIWVPPLAVMGWGRAVSRWQGDAP